MTYPLLSTASFSFFFFNDTATTEIYTLSLHDALPISQGDGALPARGHAQAGELRGARACAQMLLGLCQLLARYLQERDRKSTRLNSSHANISYAVFCLKKKKKTTEKK